MHYRKILFYIFSIIWEIGVAVQQICWIIDGNYSFMAFIWAIMEAILPYIIYKLAIEDQYGYKEKSTSLY